MLVIVQRSNAWRMLKLWPRSRLLLSAAEH
jgi:hypothetical protein